MPEKTLRLDEIGGIARDYVFKIEQKAYSADDSNIYRSTPILPRYVEVEIKGTEPYSLDNSKSVVHGCIRRFVVDTTRDIPCKILIAERIFRLWISRIDGEISDYLPDSWVAESETPSDPLARELKESEIARNRVEEERNRAEIERLSEEEFERDQQKSRNWDPLHIRRFKL